VRRKGIIARLYAAMKHGVEYESVIGTLGKGDGKICHSVFCDHSFVLASLTLDVIPTNSA